MSRILNLLLTVRLYVLLACSLIAFTGMPVSAQGRNIYKTLQAPFYDPNSSPSVCSSDTVNLMGSENEEKIFNFFIGQGLSADQAAGAVGNIMHESGGDPENIQNPAGQTKDPTPLTGETQGWGLIQWTPGAKILNIAKEQNVTGSIYELSTQLQIIWNHMKGTSPTGAVNMLEKYKLITDYKTATADFEDKIEGAGIVALESRQEKAFEALKKYGSNSVSPSDTSDASTCGDDSSGVVAGEYSLPLPKKIYNANKQYFTKPHHDYPAADIPVPEGTSVFSMTSGTVTSSGDGYNGGLGTYVFVKDGEGNEFRYQHGTDGSLKVKVGDAVKAGQRIMLSGNTGRSTGPHLHLQINVNGEKRCPQSLFTGIVDGKPPAIKSLPNSGCVGGSV